MKTKSFLLMTAMWLLTILFAAFFTSCTKERCYECERIDMYGKKSYIEPCLYGDTKHAKETIDYYKSIGYSCKLKVFN